MTSSATKDTIVHLDFVGIGAPKAGTTLVAEALAAHPKLSLSEPKEIHYFNDRMAYIHGGVNVNKKKSIAWYNKHFTHCPKQNLKGEFSTGYLYDRSAPQKLAKLYPELKIVVCLREPISRAYSQYTMFRHYFQKENRTFDEVITKEEEYIGKGLYFKQISHWLTYFPRDQFAFVFLDNLKSDKLSEIQNLYSFLSVEKSFSPNWEALAANEAKASRFPLVSKLMGMATSVLVAVGASGLLQKLKQAGLKKWLIQSNAAELRQEPISDFAVNYIKERTKGDIEQLEKLLSVNLSYWK